MILIVDDNKICRKILQNYVESFYMKTIVAKDIEEADKILKENNNIKMILLDYFMPINNGLALVNNIKNKIYKNYNKQIPIVLITAGNIEEEIIKTLTNINSIIYKPIKIEQLKTTIFDLINKMELDYEYAI